MVTHAPLADSDAPRSDPAAVGFAGSLPTTMATTSDNETRQTTTTVVTVRIPTSADRDVVSEAERRLARAEGATAVSVDGLRGLQPGLSATVVTVAVTAESRHGRPLAFESLTGVETIDP